MRAVLQRVSEARVQVGDQVTGAIGPGLLVLLGIHRDDTKRDADYLVHKITKLRIFSDENGKMNRTVIENGGSLLFVSQFTVYGDCRRGMRPSFDQAAKSEQAKHLYDYTVQQARATGVQVETGVFQASMQVFLINDGPVTLICESVKLTPSE